MSAAYSGSLQIKKKAELQEIAQALAIPDAGTREDLQQRIKKHLEDYSTNLEGDPVFAGLYTTRRRQRSLQPSSGPQPQPTRTRTPEQPLRYTSIIEERGFTPPADDLRDASQLIPKTPMSPGLPTPSPPRHSSMSPRAASSHTSPAKSFVAEVKAHPEVQAVLEMEHDAIGWFSKTASVIRTLLSSSQNIFIMSALLDFTAILYNIHGNAFFPIPPVYVASDPAVRATALATMYWALPSLVVPAIIGYLVSFSAPTSQPSFDVLSASIIRMAANFADTYPAMVFVEQDSMVQSLDVLGIRWRAVSSGITLAFAFSEAILRRNRA